MAILHKVKKRRKTKKNEKEKKTFSDWLGGSQINYFSDLFIAAMVLLWIADSVWEALIATVVTLSSVVVSVISRENCYEVSMWSSIGTNIALPLSAGGALWMIKNGVQHAIANSKNEECPYDFPDVEVDDTEEEEDL